MGTKQGARKPDAARAKRWETNSLMERLAALAREHSEAKEADDAAAARKSEAA